MKKLFFILWMFLMSADVKAQSIDTIKKQRPFSNCIKISAGEYYTPKIARASSFLNIHQLGISYERRLFKPLFAGVSFMKWQQVGSPFVKFKTAAFQEDMPFDRPPVIGELYARRGYKMLDGYVFYKQSIFKGNQFLNLGVGASYTWGTNVYLSWYWRNPEPLGDISVDYDYKKVHYWGIIPQISYDYCFLKNRIVAGVNIRGRYYKGIPKAQYDLAIHAGVNF